MEPLNIALFTYSTKPRGGVVHTLCLAEKLKELNHNVHVYALGTESGFFREVDVPFTLIPTTTKNFSDMDEKIHYYIDTYIDFLNGVEDNYDIYHAEDCISANALLELRIMGKIKQFVRTVHHIDDFTSQSLVNCQLKSILEPDYLLVVSEFWKNELNNKYSLHPVRITNGVDLDKFNYVNISKTPGENSKRKFSIEDAKTILTIGGIEPRKNSITILKAFSIVKSYFKNKGQRIVWLVGGGETLFDYREYRELFFSEMKSLGLKTGEDILILGRISDEQLIDLYNAGDVFLFPSLKEGWGLVVLEAMASGLPVIASDIEPLKEFLRDGENSLLVSPMDYTALSANIIRVLENDKLNEKLIKNGLKTAAEYSWETSAENHVMIYREIQEKISRLGRVADEGWE